MTLLLDYWKQNPLYPYLEVSVTGNVRNARSGKLLKPFLNSSGYTQVTVLVDRIAKKRTIHFLVLTTFDRPRPEGMEARHLDGTRTNARASNLQWGTAAENQRDRITHGTSPRGGQTAGRSILTRNMVCEARRRCADGEIVTDIAKSMGVNRNALSLAIRGHSWAHVTEVPPCKAGHWAHNDIKRKLVVPRFNNRMAGT